MAKDIDAPLFWLVPPRVDLLLKNAPVVASLNGLWLGASIVVRVALSFDSRLPCILAL